MPKMKPADYLELSIVNLQSGTKTPTITIPMLTPGYERCVNLTDDTALHIVWRIVAEKSTREKRSSNHVTH